MWKLGPCKLPTMLGRSSFLFFLFADAWKFHDCFDSHFLGNVVTFFNILEIVAMSFTRNFHQRYQSIHSKAILNRLLLLRMKKNISISIFGARQQQKHEKTPQIGKEAFMRQECIDFNKKVRHSNDDWMQNARFLLIKWISDTLHSVRPPARRMLLHSNWLSDVSFSYLKRAS